MNYSQSPLATNNRVFVADERLTKEVAAVPSQMEVIAHINNLGVELVESEGLPAATHLFRKSLQKANELSFFAGSMAQSAIDNSSASKNLYIYQRGEYDEGMHACSSFVSIDAELCSIHTATATILYNIGQALVRSNDNQEASNHFLRALQIAQLGSNNGIGDCKSLNGGVSIVAILSNIGNVLYRSGRFDESIRTFQKALEVGSNSTCLGQHNSHHMLELSATLNSLGVLAFHLPKADTDRALAYYEESLAIRRQVLGQDAVTKEIATT